MSRIGVKPVTVPKGVEVATAAGLLSVKGPKGALDVKVADGVTFDRKEGVIQVNRASDTPRHRANHGLMRALLANMVTGVTKGFEKKLEIIGVGYKADVRGNSLVLNLGYSHPITYPFPDGISIAVEAGTKVTVKGYDKVRVGQVAAELRDMRPPDSYKGKGVRYSGETIRLKAGKSGQK
jgi:large subunit ribosomal protein L6